MELRKDNMIGQGNTAEVYRLDDNRIIKLFREGMPKDAIEREYQNSMAVSKILDYVPKVYEKVDINDRQGIIYEEIKGTDMLKIMTTSIFKLNAYARKLAHYHQSIQKPVEASMCTVKEKLEYDLMGITVLSDEIKEKIRRHLKQLPEGNELCHFDFHPGNIVITDNKAIPLDWMTACKGDPCADVARTSILLKFGGVEHAPWIMKKTISTFQKHIYRIYIKEYLKISKRSIEDINKWELPVAAARLCEWISDSEKHALLKLVNDYYHNIV